VSHLVAPIHVAAEGATHPQQKNKSKNVKKKKRTGKGEKNKVYLSRAAVAVGARTLGLS